ncbi:MAG: hypothetical protein IKI15_12320 [Lachnospiraceae bacterium]|nr:hypothetical protein [Lachnospiraceae bacterium]
MSIEMRYFKYHFWETRIRLVILCVLSVLYFSNLAEISSGVVSVDSMVYAGIILALFVPIREFQMFNTRRNLDTWFSMPIDRWKMALVHLLNGALHIALTLLTGMLFVALHVSTSAAYYNLFQLVAYYLIMLALTLLAYGFFCFVFTQANSTTDGTLFIINYLFLPTVFYVFMDQYFENTPRVFYGIVTLMGTTSRGLQSVFWGDGRFSNSFWTAEFGTGSGSELFIVNLVLNVLICGAATVFMLRLFNRKHTEKVEDVSDSWFGFRTLIPVMAVLTIASPSGLAAYTFRIVFIYVAYVIYRKGVHLKRSDYCVIAVYAALLLMMACVSPADSSFSWLL